MDLFTQGLVGAAFTQAMPVKKAHLRIAGGFGFVAGLAPDLDAFIQSSTDPLTVLEYHRHFTHSLAFIPVGGALCALVLHAIFGRRWRLTFLQTFMFCTLGYATHGLLDATTSYGTMLLWPFSDLRVSWSLVSIVDPVFTLPVAIFTLVAWLKRRASYARIAVAWAACYLTLGMVQHDAALAMGRQIAAERGHTLMRIEAKPSFANILVWKTIYETPQHFHVDAVRAGLAPRLFEGASIAKLDMARDLPWLALDTQQAKDIERFEALSLGFVALDPQRPHRIIDVRYSFLPNEIDALWSIELSPDAAPTDHARFLTHRENAAENLGDLWRMVSGP